MKEGQAMRIYIFKSETRKDLRAFASDLMGSKLPMSHGPWSVTGVIGPDRSPPYDLPRDAIEEAAGSPTLASSSKRSSTIHRS